MLCDSVIGIKRLEIVEQDTPLGTHLLATPEEEIIGILAIVDGTSDLGEPVPDHRRSMRVLEEELLEQIGCNGDDDE